MAEVKFYPILLHIVKTAKKCCQYIFGFTKFESSVNLEVARTKLTDVVSKMFLISALSKDLMSCAQ